MESNFKWLEEKKQYAGQVYILHDIFFHMWVFIIFYSFSLDYTFEYNQVYSLNPQNS